MIRKFAIVAIATAAVGLSQLATTNAASAAAPPSFLGGSYGVSKMNVTENTAAAGSRTSYIALDGQSEEPQQLLVPAVQKVRCASSRNC